MLARVNDIYAMLQEMAPFETAESFDNVGLLLGARDRDVKRILVALDATMDVVEEAEKVGAELIVTHHPLFFRGRKHLVEEDPEAKVICRMIRSGISLISAHTNLDQSMLSGSAACANRLKLKNIRSEGFLFLGELEAPATAEELKSLIGREIMPDVRLYGDGVKRIKTLAISGGAYDEGWLQAREMGADALLTGEVRHHNALAAVMDGFVLFDAGHFGTEAPLVQPLCEYLQKRINDVQYDVTVFSSNVYPYGRT